MPVRSLSSSVLKWSDAHTVNQALRGWAEKVVRKRWDILKIGYFGSYARGDWGVGSDLDIIMVLENCSEPFDRRPLQWDLREIPVPADLLIYTKDEWNGLIGKKGFLKKVLEEVV